MTGLQDAFQINASQWALTRKLCTTSTPLRCFNPPAPRGREPADTANTTDSNVFQSTRPMERTREDAQLARRSIVSIHASLQRTRSPTTPFATGAVSIQGPQWARTGMRIVISTEGPFQSMHPCRYENVQVAAVRVDVCVSIHAPARGRTAITK